MKFMASKLRFADWLKCFYKSKKFKKYATIGKDLAISPRTNCTAEKPGLIEIGDCCDIVGRLESQGNGRIKIGDRPGLGIELNEEECLKHPYVEHNLRHYTGALTDIRPAKTEFYF